MTLLLPRAARVFVVAAVAAALAPVAVLGQAAPAAPEGRPPITFSTDPKPPVAVDGWKVETVLLAPQIESPSVVCALPDGRVLIGEDPLDNRGGKDPIDRIMCLWPDGKLTVWADHLNPVFGLAYLDGRVYVHQYPILSVFDDADGKAANRKDLINQTGKPTIGGLNDHIPAQIRLGMDGYFYMASGDRGIWGAKSNVDGREIELAGGGLIRIRPDGTGLEVYSTGTRNHLDVSMTAEDDKFTYDNTDDGHGWWTRFTHMVDGGYYGYPWDYKAPENRNDPNSRKTKTDGNPDVPFQPYTLWRMAEYGGGSPCGAVGYAEDALPAEYRDNLFHCEWGKGKVQRFVVSRIGGTFKVDQMQDFVTPGGDLRPLGIDVTVDGMGFWVTDWGYGGWHQKKPQVGRLIKVSWTGKSQAAPKPAWWLAAATGKKFEATTAELIEGLKHPAKSVRMVAQRRLAERGANAATDLYRAVGDAAAPAPARWHAIWALEGMHVRVLPGATTLEQPDTGPMVAIAGAGAADRSVRRQAIRELGERRELKAVDTLSGSLADADASIRFQVATALGRIGDAKAVPALLAKLDDPDLFVRYALFNALNRIGRADPKAWLVILAGLEDKSDAVRTNTTFALRNTYDSQLVSALAKVATDKAKPPAVRVAALLSAAELHRQPKPWGGNWWGTQPVGNPRPPKVVDWEGTTTVLSTIRDLAKDEDAAVRSAALKAMTIAPDASAVDLLVDLFDKSPDAPTRELILQALAPSKSPKAAALATAVLTDPKTPAALVPHAIAVVREVGGKDAVPVLVKLVESAESADVLEPAIDTLGSLKVKEGVPAIAKRLVSAESRLWGAAVNALQAINDKPAVDALIAAVADKRGDVRKAAVVALGQMKAKDAVPALVEAVQKKTVGGEATKALLKLPDVRAIDVYLAELGGRNQGDARDARAAVEKVKADALPLIEQRLDAGKVKPAALAVLQEIYGTYKPIREWSVIGPFARGRPLPFDPAALAKAEGSVKTADGATLAWKKVKAAETGVVDLGKETPAAGAADAYLLASVDSPAAREVFMQFGSDDNHTVWVNGQQVDDDRDGGGWKADESTVKVMLKKGRNLIVARGGNISGGWQFSAAVAAERTGKLFDAKIAPPPAGTPKPPTRDDYAAFAAGHKGDPAKGREIFLGQAASCVKCHQAVQNEGGLIGPSLVGVGAKYDRAKLVESVVYPSKQIFDGFQQTVIRTTDGDAVEGIVKSETETEIELFDSSATRQVVKKADIKSRKVSELSAMPEGLEQGMTQSQFADLIAYLESLKEGGAAVPATPKK
jgi:putative heme-binding domain-containing protein